MVGADERARRAGDEHPSILRDEGFCRKHIFLLAAATAGCGVCRTDGARKRAGSKSRAKRMGASRIAEFTTKRGGQRRNKRLRCERDSGNRRGAFGKGLPDVEIIMMRFGDKTVTYIRCDRACCTHRTLAQPCTTQPAARRGGILTPARYSILAIFVVADNHSQRCQDCSQQSC